MTVDEALHQLRLILLDPAATDHPGPALETARSVLRIFDRTAPETHDEALIRYVLQFLEDRGDREFGPEFMASTVRDIAAALND